MRESESTTVLLKEDERKRAFYYYCSSNGSILKGGRGRLVFFVVIKLPKSISPIKNAMYGEPKRILENDFILPNPDRILLQTAAELPYMQVMQSH